MTATGDPLQRRQAIVAFVLCWAAFTAYSFLRVPIPGINEPHYLGMARAEWDPQWCRGDMFLASAKPHRAFYLAIGWLTHWLSLEQTAIAGRMVSLGLVAWGWSKLARALDLDVVGALLSATVLLAIQSTGSWSGEWLIGGVESKVFAYGFVFAGWGALLAGRVNAAGLWLGLATTLHPVVGAWATIATLAGIAWRWWTDAARAARSNVPLPRLPFMLIPTLWWFVAAAPGIGWALPVLRSADAATSQLADFIQVSYRLAHHLDPWTFPRESHLFFGGLIVLWLLATLTTRLSDRDRLLEAITTAAILFGLAAMGLTYGVRPWTFPPTEVQQLQLKLLKFYPFRLADLMSAVIVAVTVGRVWGVWNQRRLPAAMLSLILLSAAILLPGRDRTPGGLTGSSRADWIAALRWINEHTPPDSLLLATNEDFAVKWWAERAEYVNFKDCPQDAAGVVEWNSRLLAYSAWATASLKDGAISRSDLADLRRRTGVTHLIVSRFGPINAPPAFSRGRFQVFDLTAAP